MQTTDLSLKQIQNGITVFLDISIIILKSLQMPLLEHGLNLHTEISILKLTTSGSEVPKELIWQDPIPKNKFKIKNKDIDRFT